jgi:hypothetical protein
MAYVHEKLYLRLDLSSKLGILRRADQARARQDKNLRTKISGQDCGQAQIVVSKSLACISPKPALWQESWLFFGAMRLEKRRPFVVSNFAFFHCFSVL